MNRFLTKKPKQDKFIRSTFGTKLTGKAKLVVDSNKNKLINEVNV